MLLQSAWLIVQTHYSWLLLLYFLSPFRLLLQNTICLMAYKQLKFVIHILKVRPFNIKVLVVCLVKDYFLIYREYLLAIPSYGDR